MKLVSFRDVKAPTPEPDGIAGVLDEARGRLFDLRHLPAADVKIPATLTDLLLAGQHAIDHVQTAFEHLLAQPEPPPDAGWWPLDRVRLLAPMRRPGKIVAIGLNYRDHAEEQSARLPEEPLVFTKFSSAIIGPEDPIVLPVVSDQVDHEVELAVIIGRTARHVTPHEARHHVAGYTIVNDVTARDLQKRDRQFVRSKSLDTFCPMGPCVLTADEWEFPPARDICLRVNGEPRQASNTRNLIFDVPDLVSRLSRSFTLEPGDLIITGTPSGVGVFRTPPVFLQAGDVIEAEIEGIGILRNPVQAPSREASQEG